MANPLQEFPIADGATRVQKKIIAPGPVSSHGLTHPWPGKPKTPRISGRPRDMSLQSAYRAVHVAHMLPDSQWILVNGKEPHPSDFDPMSSSSSSFQGWMPLARSGATRRRLNPSWKVTVPRGLFPSKDRARKTAAFCGSYSTSSSRESLCGCPPVPPESKASFKTGCFLSTEAVSSIPRISKKAAALRSASASFR